MKIWKLSMGENEIDSATFNLLNDHNVVSVHPLTKPKGQSYKSQGSNFLEAKQGDLFFLCRSNKLILTIGMFKDEFPSVSLDKTLADNGWIDREYLRLFDARNPRDYDKSFDKWWSPKNNSTFIEIPEGDIGEFEEKILGPVFEITMEILYQKRRENYLKEKIDLLKLKQLQILFADLKKDENELLKLINNLTASDKRKLLYIYGNIKNIENQPVVLLRKQIVELFIKQSVEREDILNLKTEIEKKFDKQVFRSWKELFRILYPLYYFQFKDGVVVYLNRFVHLIQKKLKIENFTDFNRPVHFDGAQNQGNDEIWFAIYNKTYKDQKHAYQLLFAINNGQFKYGLYHMDKPDECDIKAVDELCFKDLLTVYEKYVDVIKRDDSREKAMITEIADLLKHQKQKQIILQGPPGTGKTRLAKMMANFMINGSINTEIDGSIKNRVKLIQFHPSYSYEDFVRGIVAKSNGAQIEYKVENKVLATMAKAAYESYNSYGFSEEKADKYVLIIDEINRTNLSTVLGELIYALEYRGEPVESMYCDENDGNTIILPPNLYIIGTMNTADRSIGHIDYAIRRRFSFIDVLPDESVVHEQSKFSDVLRIFDDHLSPEFKKENVMLGHSYFIADDESTLETKLQYQVLPLLKEYLSDGILLESAREIIQGLEKDL